MAHSWLLALAFLVLPGLGCSSRVSRSDAKPVSRPSLPTSRSVPPAASVSVQTSATPAAVREAARNQLDQDGNDDLEDAGTGRAPSTGHFERVGKAPLALRRICDLTPLGDSLYAAHANAPLGSDGATVTRYTPQDTARPFAVAFDWNRPGQPKKGGGAGQGFLRVRNLGARLLVPDADPPYLGFWLSKTGTEGFVFISDTQGNFASARKPGFWPPLAPGSDKAGAGMVPNALHVLDVISYRGRYYASTGSVPPGSPPNGDVSPAALHIANDDLSRWEYVLGYPETTRGNVWRFTFLVRFRDRLYAGLQDYFAREQHDYVYFEPPNGSEQLTLEHAHPTRVTEQGAAQTYRWYADSGKLYWITHERHVVHLRVTDNGDDWQEITLPPDVGAPTDIVRFRDSLMIMTEGALLKLNGRETSVVAAVMERRSPFELSDYFCAAPLAVFKNELYIGGQVDGSLYKLVAN